MGDGGKKKDRGGVYTCAVKKMGSFNHKRSEVQGKRK